MHIALKRENPESIVICDLINCNPKTVQFKDMAGNLPLFIACRNPKISYGVVRLLLNIFPQASKVKIFGSLAFHVLFYNGHCPSIELFKLIISFNPSAAMTANSFGNFPIHYLCSSHEPNLDILRLLLQNSSSSALIPNKEGVTALDKTIQTMIHHHEQEMQVVKERDCEFVRVMLKVPDIKSLETQYRQLLRNLIWRARSHILMCFHSYKLNNTNKNDKKNKLSARLAHLPTDLWRRVIAYI